MQNFEQLGLSSSVVSNLTKNKFLNPTPIQAEAIPVALNGHDIIGTAQTGTGKTGAFCIPLIEFLLKNKEDKALIMTPTRELAAQVTEVLKKMLGTNNGINSVLIVGGESFDKQLYQLRKFKPRVIVGTPGRINDHMGRGNIKFNTTRFLVLDETDRMLDMGFSVTIDKIISELPSNRQTLLFSATLPNNIKNLAGKYLNNPVNISIGSTSVPVKKIKQETVHLPESEKYDSLLSELDKRAGSIIVFVKTKIGVDKMAKKLRSLKYDVGAIHGDLRQRQRDKVIRDFREGRDRIMVATDVAARGLDIPHIEHVINYDLPHCAEDYIHRIGRTGRAGAEGAALNFVSPQDGKKWSAIYRLLNPDAKIEKSPRNRGGSGSQRRDNNGGRGNNNRPGAKRYSGDRQNNNNNSKGKFRPRKVAA